MHTSHNRLWRAASPAPIFGDMHQQSSVDRRAWSPLTSTAGQSLTELALVLPILVLIFIGILDLGRAFHTQVAAANAARVGVIYAQPLLDPQGPTH